MVRNFSFQNEGQASDRWPCSGACSVTFLCQNSSRLFAFRRDHASLWCCHTSHEGPVISATRVLMGDSGFSHHNPQPYESGISSLRTCVRRAVDVCWTACMIKKATAGVPVKPCLTIAWDLRQHLTRPSLGDEIGGRMSPPLVHLRVSFSLCF